MTKPRSLAERISKHTLVPEPEVQFGLDEPQPGSNLGPCWVWRGALTNGIPMIKHEGRATPVRRLVHGATAKNLRTTGTCAFPLCVSPHHSIVKPFGRILGMTAEDFHIPPVVEDDVEDVIYAIYHEHPLDDYEPELVAEARAMIERGEA